MRRTLEDRTVAWLENSLEDTEAHWKDCLQMVDCCLDSILDYNSVLDLVVGSLDSCPGQHSEVLGCQDS